MSITNTVDLDDELADEELVVRKTPGGGEGGSRRQGGRTGDRPQRRGEGRGPGGSRGISRGADAAAPEDDPFLDDDDEMGDFIVDEGDEGERRRRAKRAAGTMVGLSAQAYEVRAKSCCFSAVGSAALITLKPLFHRSSFAFIASS